MLSRRNVFARLFTAMAGGIVASRASAATTAVGGIPKVAYHLSDLDKVRFVLGNIENHIAGEGGPGKVEIVLVVNGPALAAFRNGRADPPLTKRLAAIATAGATLGACANTLAAQKITVA